MLCLLRQQHNLLNGHISTLRNVFEQYNFPRSVTLSKTAGTLAEISPNPPKRTILCVPNSYRVAKPPGSSTTKVSHCTHTWLRQLSGGSMNTLLIQIITQPKHRAKSSQNRCVWWCATTSLKHRSCVCWHCGMRDHPNLVRDNSIDQQKKNNLFLGHQNRNDRLKQIDLLSKHDDQNT